MLDFIPSHTMTHLHNYHVQITYIVIALTHMCTGPGLKDFISCTVVRVSAHGYLQFIWNLKGWVLTRDFSKTASNKCPLMKEHNNPHNRFAVAVMKGKLMVENY